MIEIKIINSLGEDNEEIPFESPPTTKFFDVIVEIAKKSRIDIENINVAPVGGAALFPNEYQQTLQDIVKSHGDTYTLINKGVVG